MNEPTVTHEQVEAGQAVYNPRTLKLYDWVVLGLSNRFIWRCPTPRLLQHYNQHVSSNHLDVGVGSGFFVDRCKFPTNAPRLGLMDLNEAALRYAGRRVARYKPETFRCNVLETIPFQGAAFDSIAMHYLLHCLPGSLDSKAIVFDNLRNLLAPDGILFGATLLHEGVNRNFLARPLMAFYNQRGIFSNQQDGLSALRAQLEQRFQQVQIQTSGCCAIFNARNT